MAFLSRLMDVASGFQAGKLPSACLVHEEIHQHQHNCRYAKQPCQKIFTHLVLQYLVERLIGLRVLFEAGYQSTVTG